MLPPFHSRADSECVSQEDKEWPEGSDIPLKFGAVLQSKISIIFELIISIRGNCPILTFAPEEILIM